MKKLYFSIILFTALKIYGAAGDLDTDFGTDGVVTTADTLPATKVTIDSSGKILVGGTDGSGTAIKIARYTSTGEADSTFNSTGTKIFNIAGLGGIVTNSSNLVFMGITNNSLEWSIQKLNADGSDNDSVSNNSATSCVGLVIDGDGNLVSIGKNDSNELVVFKFDQSLSAVAGFGTSGVSVLDSITLPSSLAVDSNNDIFVGDTPPPSTDPKVYKIKGSDGTIDTTFGTSGAVTISSINGINSLAIDSDDKILATGSNDSNNTVVIRVNTNGTLDNTFNADGDTPGTITETNLKLGNTIGIQSTGKIVVGGTNSDTDSFALARFTTSGTLDTDFGTSGLVTTPSSDSNGIRALAIQSDNKIVGTGGSSGDIIFQTARYDGGAGGGGSSLTANASSANIAKNIPNAVTFTGTDSESTNLLTFTISTQPSNGILGSITQPSTTGNTQTALVTYTPDTDFTGTDSFAFTITDGSTTSDPATVTLNVNNYGTLSSFVSRLIEKY